MDEEVTENTEQTDAGGLPDIAGFFRKYRNSYRIFIAAVFLYGIVAVILLNVITLQYTAFATIGPSNNPSMPSISSLSSLMGSGSGSMGSMLGSVLNSSSSSSSDQYSDVLQSSTLAKAIIHKYNYLMPELFYNKWDWDTKNWISRDDPFHMTVDFVKGLLQLPVEKSPGEDDLIYLLQKNLDVEAGLLSSLTTVSWKYKNPEGAERQLRIFLREADNILRGSQRRDVIKQMAYLNNVVQTTPLTDLKTTLIGVLAQDQQLLATLDSNNYYAVSIVDEPYASRTPTFPTIIEVAATIVFLSLATWSGIILLLSDTNPFRLWLDRRLNFRIAKPAYNFFRNRFQRDMGKARDTPL